MLIKKIGFGGGCHWCTEAVFQILLGVQKVEQGWIASEGEHSSFSEAIIVHFDYSKISLDILTAIHLLTHSCTSMHNMRIKYRSAIYYFCTTQIKKTNNAIEQIQSEFDEKIITQVLPFTSFKENKEKYQNYYFKNPENQFCKRYINPKLKMLMSKFSRHVNSKIMTEGLLKWDNTI